MKDKYSRKWDEKLQLQKPRVEAQKRADGRSHEMYRIRTGEDILNKALADRHITDLNGEKIHEATIYDDKIDDVSGTKLHTDSVFVRVINPALMGGNQDAYRLRTVDSWTGVSAIASPTDHIHSYSFKNHFTQPQRKAFLADLQELEARPNKTPAEKMVIRLARMQCDDPGRTAEELVDFLDNGPAMEVHEWRLAHESDYHARWMYENDERYREEMGDKPLVQAALGRMPASGVESNPNIVAASLQKNALPKQNPRPH